jgi:hypothetical protein
MRHCWLFLTLFLAGCSTHPIANMQDYIRPGKMYANEVDPYGGVCIQQGAILTPAVSTPNAPIVVPPPVPLPGTSSGAAPPPEFPLSKVGP